MPSRMVEIKNRWHKDHKETVQGREYFIPAGGSIQIPRYEGVALMGSCMGYVKWDGDPKENPYAKALDMIDLPESGEMNVKEYRHPKTGELFLSQEALDASFRRDADKSMIHELIEGLAKNQAQPTTVSRVYACTRCDFETTNKAAYLKHSESKHESDGSKPA